MARYLFSVMLLPIVMMAIGSYCLYGSSPHRFKARVVARLQFAFINEGSVYCAHVNEKAVGKSDLPPWLFPRFYRIKLSQSESALKIFPWVEFNDEIVTASQHCFLRWRIKSCYIWGTEKTLDDQKTNIFHISMEEIEKLKEGQNKMIDPVAPLKEKNPKLSFEEYMQIMLKSYCGCGTDSLIQNMSYRYWQKKKVPIPDNPLGPWGEDWPKGSSGIYFDFLPAKSPNSISFFVLFDKAAIPSDFFRKDGIYYHKDEPEENITPLQNIVTVWLCKGNSAKTQLAKQDLRTPPPIRKEFIVTDMKDPFYVFDRNDAYYFATLSGKIYVAPYISINPKEVGRLIADLDSDSFPTREKATRDLRAIGKPVQQSLEAHLSKSSALEQRRRIAQILNELKPLPDRKTKLLWHDDKRPVDKLLFDQDKNKVYAFTKPNREKQVYFFEVTDKPQPRIFTGNIAPDSPASLPASTRIFLEYARFVRKEK